MAVVVISGAALLVGAFAFFTESSRPGPSETTKLFTVERGASAAAIGEALEREDEVRSGFMFRLATRAFARGRSLQAGEYEIPAAASLRDIVTMMADGRAVQHAVTIPEGYTSAQVIEVLANAGVLIGDTPPVPPEGSILPETYHVQRGMTRAALLQQMREAHDAAVAEIWARRAANLPISTPEQAVILASIVEKETGVATERPQVASVFTNRLRIGMALQSDPTIIYGVCRQLPARCRSGRLVNERTGQPRTIRESEIALRTGYNTYQINALPPTPIANPGRAALEAVVNPPASEYLFFVADGSGGHAFARTVAEHNANVASWRVIERERLAAETAARP